MGDWDKNKIYACEQRIERRFANLDLNLIKEKIPEQIGNVYLLVIAYRWNLGVYAEEFKGSLKNCFEENAQKYWKYNSVG